MYTYMYMHACTYVICQWGNASVIPFVRLSPNPQCRSWGSLHFEWQEPEVKHVGL